jgi:two-component system response regulator MprA
VTDVDAHEELLFADVRIDVAERSLYRDGARVDLTPLELALAEMFLRHPRVAMSRARLMNEVWGYDYGTMTKRLDAAICTLRRKMGEPRLIHTVWGSGYVLREAA